MDRASLESAAYRFLERSPLNRVTAEDALRPDLAGMRMFEEPLFGVAAAEDPLFETLREPGIVGPHLRLPREWLPDARSVVSFFLPFTDAVVKSNRASRDRPSPEWLHARIEGQVFINALCAHLAETLVAAGHAAVAPSIHPDFRSWSREPGPDGVAYTSNWSERHAAHVAGLGTFGLSAGIITGKGMAGRLGSVVTARRLPADARPYSRYDEYCNYCGACEAKCPADAVSATRGRDKPACSRFLDATMEKYHPRYGCGQCQVAVPCERGIPPARPQPHLQR